MIGLILIYYIGKPFYTLAEINGKSKWLYAILGVASYYLGAILTGVVLGVFWIESISINAFYLQLLGLPIGLLLAYLFYKYLEKDFGKLGLSNWEALIDDDLD